MAKYKTFIYLFKFSFLFEESTQRASAYFWWSLKHFLMAVLNNILNSDLLSPSLWLSGTERFLYAGHWGGRVRPRMADAVTPALQGFIGAR